jgi:hypothetical protein
LFPAPYNRCNQPKKLEHMRYLRRNVMAFLKKIGVVFMLLLMFGSILIR